MKYLSDEDGAYMKGPDENADNTYPYPILEPEVSGRGDQVSALPSGTICCFNPNPQHIILHIIHRRWCKAGGAAAIRVIYKKILNLIYIKIDQFIYYLFVSCYCCLWDKEEN